MLIDGQHIDILTRLGVNLEGCHLGKIAYTKEVEAQLRFGEEDFQKDDTSRNEISRNVVQQDLPSEIEKLSAQYKCDSCSRAFHRNGNLQKHMIKKHKKKTKQTKKNTTRNQYNCNVCSGSFASKFNLKLHKRRHHTNETPRTDDSMPKCKSCDKSFSTKGNLKMHTMKKRCLYKTEILSKLTEHKKGTKEFEYSIQKEMNSSTEIEFDDSDDESTEEPTLTNLESQNNREMILPAIEFDDSDSD